MKIANNVYLIKDKFVNTYLLANDQDLLLIDTGLPKFAPTIIKYIQSLGFNFSDLHTILLTHSDGDHVGSAEKLRKITGAKIYASKIEAAAIENGIASRPLTPKGIVKVFYKAVSGLFKPSPFLVDRVISDKDEFPFLGGLRVLETKGHTPGHLSYFSPSTGILFAGDSIRINGKETAQSIGANTWDLNLAKDSYEEQVALKPRYICAGHGLLLN